MVTSDAVAPDPEGAAVPQHEIVNDTIDGVPVAVTYSSLCASGMAFDRTSETGSWPWVAVYDRLTESLWPQIEGVAGDDELTGTESRPLS